MTTKLASSSSRGQATVELMIILPLLLIILAISISIFAQQMLIVDSLRYRHAVERSAEQVAEIISHMQRMPPQSDALFYIPKSPETQTITLTNGLLEVKGAQYYASILLPFTNGGSFSMSDGDTIRMTMDGNNQLHMQVIP